MTEANKPTGVSERLRERRATWKSNDKNYHKPHQSRWYSMMRRCYNKMDSSYSYYGARGIRVCKKWHDYSVFRVWAEKTFKLGTTLDRIDNFADYSENNCRWATKAEQNSNRRRTPKIILHESRLVRKAIEWQHAKFGDPKTRTEKYCSGCNAKHPLSSFGVCRSSHDGHAYKCKGCERKKRAEYRKKKAMNPRGRFVTTTGEN